MGNWSQNDAISDTRQMLPSGIQYGRLLEGFYGLDEVWGQTKVEKLGHRHDNLLAYRAVCNKVAIFFCLKNQSAR